MKEKINLIVMLCLCTFIIDSLTGFAFGHTDDPTIYYKWEVADYCDYEIKHPYSAEVYDNGLWVLEKGGCPVLSERGAVIGKDLCYIKMRAKGLAENN